MTPSPSCQADVDQGETLDLAGASRRSRAIPDGFSGRVR
jgi:hypothetical protein